MIFDLYIYEYNYRNILYGFEATEATAAACLIFIELYRAIIVITGINELRVGC